MLSRMILLLLLYTNLFAIGTSIHIGGKYTVNDFQDMEEIGFNQIRIIADWSFLNKNNFYWNRLAKYTQYAKKHNMTILLSITNSPKEFTKIKNIRYFPDKIYLKEYQDFIKKLSLLIAKDINILEIWNEPDFIYKTKSIQSLYAQYKPIFDITRKIFINQNKKILISTPSLTSKFGSDFLTYFIKKEKKNIDIINYHFYNYWNKKKSNNNLKHIINIAKKYNKKIYITEVGVPSSPTTKINFENFENIGFIEQAYLLIKNITILYTYNIENIFIFQWRDRGLNYHNKENTFGLLMKSNIKKPSYYALKWLLKFNINKNTQILQEKNTILLKNNNETLICLDQYNLKNNIIESIRKIKPNNLHISDIFNKKTYNIKNIFNKKNLYNEQFNCYKITKDQNE